MDRENRYLSELLFYALARVLNRWFGPTLEVYSTAFLVSVALVSLLFHFFYKRKTLNAVSLRRAE